MSVDEAFIGAGVKPGLEIWRIEAMKPVRQDPKTYGEFYTGDSYIILNSKIPKGKNSLEWDLHFWLGTDTSTDEKGVAAYKTVELDDSLGGGPVQYREVCEHESKLFMSYFKTGIKYHDGGVDSGFKKVERDKYETRLLHVKGKRNIRVKQVARDVSSLNQGDVFILDAGLMIFVWNGPESSKMERVKACEAARRIKDEERGGRADLKIIDEGWETDEAFFKALGSSGPIAKDSGDDDEFEKFAAEQIKLYRISDASGELEMTEVSGKPMKREHLESEDCFILDSGPSGVFVWVGKQCTKEEKKSAWKNATDFLAIKGYADWTPVMQLVEGAETPLFKQYFTSWPEKDQQKGFGTVHSESKVAKVKKEKFDSTTLHARRKREEDKLPDDGKGHLQLWRVENAEMVPQPEDTYGLFYTGDCYVMLYTYIKNNKEFYIVYFWQGSKSTTDERGASAIYAQRVDDVDTEGAAVQVRVVQGREPEHFLRIFQGKMIIFLGGINNTEPDSTKRLFQVKGTNEFNTKAMQVIARGGSLNSGDVFLLENGDRIFIWYGKGASDDECKLAKDVIGYLFPDRNSDDVVEIKEGFESADFWLILGGKEVYATSANMESNNVDMPPRLFQCSNASGNFKVEEIVDFCQEDLVEDDVMILDAIDEIYVWLGAGANDVEKKESLQTAVQYIESDPSGRTPDNTVIQMVKMGLEPPGFTGHFLGWDPEKWSQGKSYEDLKKELGQEGIGIVSVQDELAIYNKKHPYKDLINGLLPKGVDPVCKETYLTDEEFQEVFKMTKEEFGELREWKQINAKKKVKLF